MRTSKSRSRSKQNRNRSVGNVVNRVFDSSGPEGKVRGTPQQIIEKYNQLARDAQLANDRVATENFQQHAEYYQRLLGHALKEQEARRENIERENRERQAERERERSERTQQEDQDITRSESFEDGLSQTDQPDELDIQTSDNKLGLIDTPENLTNEADSAERKENKPPRKQGRDRIKTNKSQASVEFSNPTTDTFSPGSDEQPETTA